MKTKTLYEKAMEWYDNIDADSREHLLEKWITEYYEKRVKQ